MTSLFFCGEAPPSRRYGRTAALRLCAQPCDEDDDEVFFCFSNLMENRWNEVDRGKRVPVPLRPPWIPHGLTRDRTRPSAVGVWRLTVWTVARPVIAFLLKYSTTTLGLYSSQRHISILRQISPVRTVSCHLSVTLCNVIESRTRKSFGQICVPRLCIFIVKPSVLPKHCVCVRNSRWLCEVWACDNCIDEDTLLECCTGPTFRKALLSFETL
jgi:hypothetical protein